MNNKYVLILLVSSTLLLVSCKHTMNAQDSFRKKGDFANLMDAYHNSFRDSYSDAALLLVRHSKFNTIGSYFERFSVGIINDSMAMPEAIYLNNVVLNAENEYTLDQYYDEGLTTSIYGTELTIKLDDDVLTDSFYNSTPINVNYPIEENYTIKNGLTFTWNSDPNSQGVIFHVSALIDGNSDTTEILEKELMIADNGSFTIPSGFLDEFPAGRNIEVTFKRGNYVMLNAPNNRKVSVIAMSSCGGGFHKSE